MKSNLLNRLFTAIASFSLLVNSLGTPLLAIAQEVTPTPTPIDTVTSTPTDTATPTPTDTATPTIEATATPTASPDLTPTPDITPIPTVEVTPTPTDLVTPTPTVEAIVSPAPETTPTTPGPPSESTPTSDSTTPAPSPSATPEVPQEHGNVSATLLHQTNASTVTESDLGLAQSDSSATLTTNKPDYAPTDAVVITGTGFIPNKTYTIEITSQDPPAVDFKDQVKANDKGDIFYTYQLDGNYRPNYKVEVLSGNTIVASVAFTDGIGDIWFDSLTGPVGGLFTASGHWAPTGNQCWTSGGGFHYFIHVIDGNPGPTLATVNPAGCNENYIGSVAHDDRDTGGHWAAIASSTNGNVAQTPATFSLSPGTHTICAQLLHVNPQGGDSVDATACWPANVIVGSFTINKHSGSAQGPLLGGAAFSVCTGATHTGGETCAGPVSDNGAGDLDSTAGIVKIGGLATGTYHVHETTVPAGYNGDSTTPSGTINAQNTNVTVNMVNTLQQAHLTLVKTVTKDNGGSAAVTDWTLSASGPTPISGTTGNGSVTNAAVNSGTYTLSESGGPNGYTPSSWSCVKNTGAPVLGSSITLAGGDSATCTINNDDQAAHLIVIKHVIKDNGGTASASDFTMTIHDVTASGGNSFAGAENPGTDKTLTIVGSYSVTESGPAGYDDSYSSDCTGTIALGETKTCTVTNDDSAPSLTLVKQVTNNDGGTAIASAWTLTATGPTGFSGTGPSVSNGASFDAGTYNVSENGGPLGYIASDWVCVGGDQTDGDTVSISLGDQVTCTITNDDVPATITLTKEVINTYGGLAVSGDFTLTIDGNGIIQGTPYQIDSNTLHAINESGLDGYEFVSITGDALCPSVLGGTVTLDEGQNISCTIMNHDLPAHLTVIKHVINDNGGTSVAGDFTMNVTGTEVSDPSFAGDEGGVTVDLDAGSYSVDENYFAGYTKSIGENCSGTIANGESKTCTITNDDQPATLIVKKVIGGGDLTYSDFSFQVNDRDTQPFEGDGQNDLTVGAGNYTVTEPKVEGYTTTYNNCTEIQIPNGGIATCTITNTLIPILGLNIAKSNDKSGGTSAGDTVTYTLVVTNNGNTTLGDISVSDVLPGGFSYVTGSTTGATTSDPNISGGVLTWSGLGPLASGASLTITYKATIANDLSDGSYKNFATCKSFTGRFGEEGFVPNRDGEVDCNVSNSTVPLSHGQGYGGNLTPQVLGAATELPASGNDTGLLLFTIAAIIGGIAIKIYGRRPHDAKALRGKKYGKN